MVSRVSMIGRIVVSSIVILGFYGAFFAWIYLKITGEVNEPLTLMVGASITAFTLVVGYWIGTSAGSSDKDQAQQATTERLVEAVATSSPAGPRPPSLPAVPKPVRWTNLTDAEMAAISTATASDTRVAKFVVDAQDGGSTFDELDYLVSKGLLTAARVEEIKKAGT